MEYERLVRNCDVRFEIVCPMKWDELEATKDELIKFCKECKKEVYCCKSPREAKKHAKLDHCIAKRIGLPDGTEGELLGAVGIDDHELERRMAESVEEIEIDLESLENDEI